MAGQELACPSCQANISIPALELGPGVTLGDFFIEKHLGQGGMGEVFLARQKALERPVALKVLPPAKTQQNKDFYNRFMQEIRMLGRLEHPNIVMAYHAGEDSGHYYYAMSYVDGEDLNVIVERDGALAEDRALQIVQRVAEALAYAWEEQRLLHRDIKPGNIMLDGKGEVKLLDLGLAKSLNEESGLTILGSMVGTPHYISPEQTRGDRELDCRSDIFSLGSTLYFMLTAREPFVGDDIMQVLYKVISAEPPPPRELNPAISAGCARLLALMMAKDPAARPADWRVLGGEVELVLNGLMPMSDGTQDGAPAATKSTVTPPAIPKKLTVAGAKSRRARWLKIAVIVFLVFCALIVIGDKTKLRKDQRRAGQLVQQARELIASRQPAKAAELMTNALPKFHKKVRKKKNLTALLTEANALVRLDKQSAEARRLLAAGNLTQAAELLDEAVRRLPKFVKAPPETAALRREIELCAQKQILHKRSMAFYRALLTQDWHNGWRFVTPELVREHGKRRIVAWFRILGAAPKLRGLTPKDVRIRKIALSRDLKKAKVVTELRIRHEWRAPKPSNWVRAKDNNWYLVFGAGPRN